jgi:hypothetical protein
MRKVISQNEITEKLKKEKKISNYKISIPLNLRKLLKVKKDQLSIEISFENCDINEIIFESIEFFKKITIKNSKIKSANFFSSYFIGGLTIESCEFENEVDFQCGGHNMDGAEIRFVDNIFSNFVNFFDCYFIGPFIMKNNIFKKGTNLLGNKGEPYEVTFETEPKIENIKGNLELNGG